MVPYMVYGGQPGIETIVTAKDSVVCCSTLTKQIARYWDKKTAGVDKNTREQNQIYEDAFPFLKRVFIKISTPVSRVF